MSRLTSRSLSRPRSRSAFTFASAFVLVTAVLTSASPSFARDRIADGHVAREPLAHDHGDPDRRAPERRTRPDALRIAPPVLDRAQLRAKLLDARRKNLAAFHAYRIAGVYPSNVFTSTLGNVWRDQDGHLCAAATIIHASGAVELVERIADDNNFFKIADVEQGPVMDWILTSGLTQEELVRIQRPFRPVASKPVVAPATDSELDAPAKPAKIEIDPAKRAAETRRLAKLYRTIERELRGGSIDVAVERLMKRPDLARHL